MDLTAAPAIAAAILVITDAAARTGRTVQALSAGARRLVEWIRRRQEPEIAEAIARVDADPTDQASIDNFVRTLAAQAVADPELEQELQDLVAQAPEAVIARKTAQAVMIFSGSWIGGQSGQGPAAGGGGGPAFGGGAGGAGGAGGNTYPPPGEAKPPVAGGGGGGGGGVIPIIREDGSVEIGRPGAGGPGGSFLPEPGADETRHVDED